MAPPARRVLLVDDDMLVLRSVEAELKAAGLAVMCVREPTKVVSVASSFEAELILLDRHMTVLNGAEVLRALRSFPRTAQIPVVFLTGSTGERELLRGLRAGAVDVLFKPYEDGYTERVLGALDAHRDEPADVLPLGDEQLLARLLRHHARARRTGSLVLNPGTPFEGRAQFEQGELVSAEYGPLHGRDALREMLWFEEGVWTFETGADATASRRPPPIEALRTGPPRVAPPAPLLQARALFVDDDEALRRLFQTHLERGGFEVALAADGEEGWARAQTWRPDVVVTDLNMPRLDGWGFLRQLKADHHTREIPVVFLSAHDDYRETLRAARCGAHDSLPKEARPDRLVQRIHFLVAPKLEVDQALVRHQPVTFETSLVGLTWLLRRLSELGLSGELSVEDEWGRHSLLVRDGQPVDAVTRSMTRNASGLGAVAALLVSRFAKGSFSPSRVALESRLPLSMSELIERTCDTLNQLEGRVALRRLLSAERFSVDEPLYLLFQRVGSERDRRLARAICEEGLPPGEAAKELALLPEQLQDGLRELLRRRVISFPNDLASP